MKTLRDNLLAVLVVLAWVVLAWAVVAQVADDDLRARQRDTTAVQGST